MPEIDKIIDHQIYYVRNIGCVVNIVDEDQEEKSIDELKILLKDY